MNGMILQTPTESKDIKLSGKKGLDTKSEKEENLFENLIGQLLEEEGETKNSNFLLGKLLNLSSDFENKGKVISEFSKGDLLSEEENETISLEELFKVALAIKNGESFSTESPELKTVLENKDVVAQLKEATNIKELLKIADKNGLKVKNFEFLSPETALDPKDKKMVQKITSEEIFKMIEPKLTLKETPLTQSVLTKIINQEMQKEKTGKNEQQTTLASLLSKETKPKEEIKVDKVIITAAREIKKIVVNEKTASTKIEVVKNVEKEIKNEEPTLEVEAEVETFKRIKPEKSPQNTLATLLKNELGAKELKPLQTQTLKEEPLLKTESEVKETSHENTTAVTEIKSEGVQKAKEPSDIKKTFSTFAMEFKEKVEAYKPPMMKINMQLSPGNLGDVDVTLITRGNNLQVNINSNTSSMAIFMQNQAEFKTSLVNMGFSDLQMNFGDKREEDRNQHQQQKENQTSDYHDSLENEETESIEMILPNYV